MEPEPQGLDEALAQNEELCVSLRDPVAVREEERDGVTVSEPQGEGLVLSELVLQALNDAERELDEHCETEGVSVTEPHAEAVGVARFVVGRGETVPEPEGQGDEE